MAYRCCKFLQRFWCEDSGRQVGIDEREISAIPIRLDMILRIKNHSFMKPILEVLTTYHSLGPCLVKSLGMAIKKSVSFWTGDISAVEIYAI